MMNNSRPIVNISLLLGTIIAVSAFFLVFNNIPVQALHKEEQLLESFDDLADFAKAVRNGDADIEEIPIQSMKAANIYDDADDSLKDCIDQAAKIGDSLTDREVVHCVDDVNYFNNKYSNSTNSTVPTTATSTATTDFADTGTDTTSTSDTGTDTTSTSDTGTDTTSTSDTGTDTTSTSNADTTSTSNADTTSTSNADTTSTSGNANENSLVDELVKTGKFTEAEAREFVNNNMQSGAGTDTTSDTTSTSNADTNTADTTSTSNADTNTADTTSTSNADTNTADTTSTSNADTNTDSSASDDTSSSNNENNNNQSSNNNSNNPEDYDDLDELVKDIKNGNVDSEEISLSAFQNSGAYQGADQETQDCIDLAGKIGHNLGDQEIVNCSEDPNFYRNEISNSNDNNAGDSSNNADDSSNNPDSNSDSSNNTN
jgi:polyhydroxyalkanoate synthesis regulator phasin